MYLFIWVLIHMHASVCVSICLCIGGFVFFLNICIFDRIFGSNKSELHLNRVHSDLN